MKILLESILVATLAFGGSTAYLHVVGADGVSMPVKETKVALATYREDLLRFHQMCGHYPDHLEDLAQPFECEGRHQHPGLSHELRKDGWGRDFVYKVTEDGFEMGSLGADHAEGGEGFNSDFWVTGSP